MSKYAVYYLITDDKKIRFRIQVLTHLIIDCNTHNLREKISEYSERDLVNRFQERIIIIIKMQKLRKMKSFEKIVQ